MAQPGASSLGTSFIECTHRSASPSTKARSSSFVNMPLSPILSSGLSSVTSPVVLSTTSSASSPGDAAQSASFTVFACHSASALPRVAIRSFVIYRCPFVSWVLLPSAKNVSLSCSSSSLGMLSTVPE